MPEGKQPPAQTQTSESNETMFVEDFYKQCVRELKDEGACKEVAKTVELLETLKLEDCVERHIPSECYNLCMKKCQDSNCEKLCERAVIHAVATNKARKILAAATRLVVHAGIALPEAIGAIYIDLLAEYERRIRGCEGKLKLVTLFSSVVGELVGATGIKELALLMAPAAAIMHDCIKQDEPLEAELDELLEGLKLLVGEEIVARLNAALEEGAVKIGRLIIRFPPLRKT